MMLRIVSILSVVIATLGLTLPALALDLQTARAQGLVGEKLDGYIIAVKPSTEVNALVKDINARRLQEYTRISKENGKPVDVVAKLAVEPLVQKLSAGALYQGRDGSWKTK